MEVSGYNLSWHTFTTHLSEVRRELYRDKYFSDITLISDDLRTVSAHRIVLSAASPVLKKLLMINPTVQTQLFLKGIKHQQLDSVLKFIYHGEVQVPSHEIDSFLRASSDLEITELSNISRTQHKSEDDEIIVKDEASKDMIVLNNEKNSLHIEDEGGEITAGGDPDISLENFHQYRGISPFEIFKHFIFENDVSNFQNYNLIFEEIFDIFHVIFSVGPVSPLSRTLCQQKKRKHLR